MPMALPLVGAAFLAAGTVATAVGLGTALMIGTMAVSWAAVLTVTGVALMAVSMLTMKIPKPSSGQVLSTKLDPKSPVPVMYGRSATGGYVGYRATYGKKNKHLALVAILSAGPIAGYETYTASDHEIVWNGTPALGMARAEGIAADPNSKLYQRAMHMRVVSAETLPATQTIVEMSGGRAFPGNPGKLSGLAHAIMDLEYDTEKFPNGVPASVWTLRGVKLYDPRRDSTFPGGSGTQRRDDHTTWQFSENPFLAALDWTLGRWWGGGKQYGIGAKWPEVDVAAFVAGANIADANGWKIGGVVTTADDKFSVLATILQAGGGVPISRGAQISCTFNAPRAATFAINPSDVIGEVEVMTSTSWRDRANTIIPTYREETHKWEMIAGEEVSSPVYIAEDGGEKKTVEAEFTLVQQARQAHQLATYELCNSREMLTFNIKGRIRLLDVRVGDAVLVNIPQLGSVSQKCIVMSREFNPSDLTVSLALKSETDAKHAFALGQAQVAPPSPVLSGYDPSNPGAPDAAAWSIVANSITDGTGVTIPAIVVAGENDDPNTASIIIEYRPIGNLDWMHWGTFGRAARVIEITSVTPNTNYEVAISYRTVRGVTGDRLILSQIAGPLYYDWSAGVIVGDTRPEDNATVGAPWGTTIGDRSVEDVLGQIAAQQQMIGEIQVQPFPPALWAEIEQGFEDAVHLTTAGDNRSTELFAEIRDPETGLQSAHSRIATEEDARVAEDLAIAGRTSTLEASVNDPLTGLQSAHALIESEELARVNADSVLAGRATTLEGTVNNPSTGLAAAHAAITTEQGLRVAGDAANATAITNVGARLNNFNGTGKSVEARVSESFTAIANQATAQAQALTTVNSTLGGQIATAQTSISTVATALGVTQSRWGVALDSNGWVTGISAMNGGPGQDYVRIDASRFMVGPPGGAAYAPFEVSGGVTYINTARIRHASIDTLWLAGGAVGSCQVATAPDAYVPASQTVNFIETGWMIIGDGAWGQGVIDVAYTVDGTSGYDTAAQLRLFVDTGGGWHQVQSQITGISTTGGNTYWRQSGGLTHVVAGAQVRVLGQCHSHSYITASVSRPLHIRDIVLTLGGTKR